MKTGRSWLMKGLAALSVGAFASTAALSDVLELGSEGARWVAGGPAPEVVPTSPDTARPDNRSLGQLVASLPSGVAGSRPSFSPLERSSITSKFGYRRHPIKGGQKLHAGVDLAAPSGTPVYATALGVVSKSGWLGGYGLLIKLEHADAIQTRYGHLSRLAVGEGQIVAPGELIGYVGSTGRSTGPHLHYEVRIRGAAIDPLPYMRAN